MINNKQTIVATTIVMKGCLAIFKTKDLILIIVFSRHYTTFVSLKFLSCPKNCSAIVVFLAIILPTAPLKNNNEFANTF